MPSKKKLRSQSVNPQACVFCQNDEDDELVYGKFIRKKDLSVHHNCMFFASGLGQHTKKESVGILGFLILDIKQEVLRGNKLRCFYCKKQGATVGCCAATCRRTFHFPCAVKNHALHQFFGSFNSYCNTHKPIQKYIKTPKDELLCRICSLSLSTRAEEDCLYAPCCKNNWYHKSCLQLYATSAGRYFFKCPMCNNSSEFIKEMEMYGIHIPEKDASWELEENAYQDLLFRPECGTLDCQCNQGRKYDGESEWALLSCCLCGSKARHRFCENLNKSVKSWKCSECKDLEDQLQKNKCHLQVSSKISEHQKPLDGLGSKESTVSNCVPSCSSGNSATDISSLTSIANLKRALRCVVQVTPIKVVTDSNGITKPVLNESSANIKRKLLGLEPDLNKKLCLRDFSNELAGKNSAHGIKKEINVKALIPAVKPLSKKWQKNKHTCTHNTCIRKFFGLDCPNLKNNRLL